MVIYIYITILTGYHVVYEAKRGQFCSANPHTIKLISQEKLDKTGIGFVIEKLTFAVIRSCLRFDAQYTFSRCNTLWTSVAQNIMT